MKAKIKTEKLCVTLSKETMELLNKISRDCDMTKILVVQRGIELLAERKGIKK